MTELYQSLLNATIEHLESLRHQGVRHVHADAVTLAVLKAPITPAAPAPVQAPKPAAAETIPPAAARVNPKAPAPLVVAPVAALETAVSAPAPRILTREAKEAAMSALRAQAMACVKCPNLVAARKNVVFGVGDIHSPLMFVGEAPGADEDEQGEPFVGAAGQLLTKIIVAMGFTRQTVYIANILKCRPDTPGQAFGNRKPTAAEMQTCLPYVLEQIDLIQPRVIVALGATAIEGLLGRAESISRLRGKFQTFRGIPMMPTFHPAYLLRNQAITEKRKVWEDMLQVLVKLGVPITEKQNGYFRKQ